MALGERELAEAFTGASREGERFFGDPTVYLERYLPDPRHLEVQVLADRHGNVIHLGERDCSIQRRHQKLIEESPAPPWIVSPELRERVGQVGVDAARAVDYVGAGTVEGLLVAREQGGFDYLFLEMNTRVQVEHSVTEMTTGVDIVKQGIRVAAGERLPLAQSDVSLRGHAIECRINAEDAARNFAPAPGRIGRYREPAGPGVRVDSGVGPGAAVSAMYDPLVAKLIVWDADREQATARMRRALSEYELEGLTTLIPFHVALLGSPQWARGETCRDLLEDSRWLAATAPAAPAVPAALQPQRARQTEQAYTVEVSGRRFEVRVIGPAPPGSGAIGAEERDPLHAPIEGAAGRAAPPSLAGLERGHGCARVPPAGQHVEGPRQAGGHGAGGSAALHHRGDEDGERDHRPQSRQDRRAADRRGRRRGRGRSAGDDQERLTAVTFCAWTRRWVRVRRPSGSGAAAPRSSNACR